MTKEEALALALIALHTKGEHHPRVYEAIAAIQAALAQPAQEPVAWMWKDMRGQDIVSLFEPRLNSVPLYTASPHHPWIWLSDADIQETIDSICQYSGDYDVWLARKIEQKIRSMNNE